MNVSPEGTMQDTAAPLRISFADLTHTGQVIASNTFPLGVYLVAAFARANARVPLEVEVFKYPDDFSAYLDCAIPEIACFSNFSWNEQLATGYAAAIKHRAPATITVFGGPNCPLTAGEQESFLKSHPEIDFYVKKSALLAVDETLSGDFSFDFVALEASGFRDHPTLHHRPGKQPLQFAHSPEQCELIAGYVKQYGTTLNGLGRILLRSHVNKLHRQARHG